MQNNAQEKCKHILVVSDEKCVDGYLVRALSGLKGILGEYVIFVSTTEAAVEKIKTLSVSHIITRIIRPGIDGREVLRFARKADDLSRVYWITGGGIDYANKFLEDEMRPDGIICTPFTLDELSRTLNLEVS